MGLPQPGQRIDFAFCQTGQVLSQENPDAITYPASLTKMMTLYLTFEALNAGKLRLDQYLPVSYAAASRAPTKLGLRPGESIAVQDLILGLVTRSANDAACVLAEGLAGSEPTFAENMTRKARNLGMTRTVYRNASGLPDPTSIQRHVTRHSSQLLCIGISHGSTATLRRENFISAAIPSTITIICSTGMRAPTVSRLVISAPRASIWRPLPCVTGTG